MQQIFNADDFGRNLCVNKAVMLAFKKGILNSASLMVNAGRAEEAFRFASENPELRVGIHLTLTREKSLKAVSNPSTISLVADHAGFFKHGFLRLLLFSLFRKKTLQKEAETEMRSQIELAIRKGLTISHLDSHRHIHMIPALFAVAEKLQKAYKIPRLRIVNEEFAYSFSNAGKLRCLRNGGFAKYLLLKFFSHINGTRSSTYFYSILYTMQLWGENVASVRYPSRFTAIEMVFHPEYADMDKKTKEPTLSDCFLSSPDRKKEFLALMDKSLPKRIHRQPSSRLSE